MPLAKDIDAKKLARLTEGYSGADIEAVCREAGLNAMREDMNSKSVKKKHFDAALDEVKPSIDQSVIRHYENLMERMRANVTKDSKKEELNYVG